MSMAGTSRLAVRAASSFEIAIAACQRSLNTRRPIAFNSSIRCSPSASYLCRSFSTRIPTSARPSPVPHLLKSAASPSPFQSIQKCAFNTSISNFSSSSSSSSIESSSSTTGASTPSSQKPETLSIYPFRAKRTWPPDMSKWSPKQQFRLERKYRRRAKLKWARPTWSKWTKIVQWMLIGYVLIYCVMYLDLEEKENPFLPIRDYVHKSLNGLLSTPSSPSSQGEPTTPISSSAKSNS
ncbi:hypothetical protein PAAG_02663 [Paracoccidioides lutzii Pb01]|uniref:Uncharacterized protein n=1 Tax=Paracoccidioides lutzii (strain ATCC MYA-826 / Pb01) TaxID=502779 RepID=C1GVW8_PARBA|nr:hypothetical protein PAAG_02663 [Paracoccidioides lutzii Pb01]EEH40687.2 hypothetical protein PAAG_02663 [Paracoccidioides lutzii Pb01]